MSKITAETLITVGILTKNKEVRSVLSKIVNSEDDIKIVIEAENGLDLFQKLKMNRGDCSDKRTT